MINKHFLKQLKALNPKEGNILVIALDWNAPPEEATYWQRMISDDNDKLLFRFGFSSGIVIRGDIGVMTHDDLLSLRNRIDDILEQGGK